MTLKQFQPLSIAPVAKPTTPSESVVPVTEPQFKGNNRPTNEEKNAVLKMQSLMSDIGTGFLSEADSISKIHNLTTEDIKSIANALSKSATGFDGKWGNNTNNGIISLNKLLVDKDKLATKDFRQNNAQEIISAANANLKELLALMDALKINKYITTEGVEVKPSASSVYDNIFGDFSAGTIDPEFKGPIAVSKDDLSSLDNFYDFVESNKSALTINQSQGIPTKRFPDVEESTIAKVTKKDLKKLAQANIFNVTVEDFDKVLNWMTQRSRKLFHIARKSGNAVEQQTAEEYRTAIANLKSKWDSARNFFLQKQNGLINPEYLENTPIVEPPTPIAETTQTQVSTTTTPPSLKDQTVEYDVNREEESNREIIQEAFNNPPLNNMINIKDLSRKYATENADWFDEHLVHGIMQRDQLWTANPKEIWSSYVKDPGQFIDFIVNAKKDIPEAFSMWLRVVEPLKQSKNARIKRIYKAKIKQQVDQLERWVSRLSVLERRVSKSGPAFRSSSVGY